MEHEIIAAVAAGILGGLYAAEVIKNTDLNARIKHLEKALEEIAKIKGGGNHDRI